MTNEKTFTLTLSQDELADIEEALRHRAERAHNHADAILADETKPGEVRASLARARRQCGNRLSTIANRVNAARKALWSRA